MTSGNGAKALERTLPMPDLTPESRGGFAGLQPRDISPKSLSAAQKAALVIAALGPEAAGPIIERVEDKHLRAFARAYAHLHTIPQAALKVVAEEFMSQLGGGDTELKGGVEETKELLRQFISQDEIVRLMEGLDVPGGESVWEKLDRAEDEALSEYLATQNMQLVAVVLSKINTEKASRILNMLEEEVAMKIIARLAKPMHIDQPVLNILSETIERDFLAPLRASPDMRNPGQMIGSMMNNVMSEKREKLMAYIAESQPDIVADVKKSLLTFQDVAERVPANAITMVIKEIEGEDFLQAVKFGRQNAPSSVEFIFSNISQRMRQQYEEEIEKLKPITVEEAEAAQSSFMTIVRRLAASGEIELNEPKSEGEDGEEGSDASGEGDAE